MNEFVSEARSSAGLTLTLNRPEPPNALNRARGVELQSAVERAALGDINRNINAAAESVAQATAHDSSLER